MLLLPCRKRLAADGTALLSTISMPIVSTCNKHICLLAQYFARLPVFIVSHFSNCCKQDSQEAITVQHECNLTAGAALTFFSSTTAGASSTSSSDADSSPSSLQAKAHTTYTTSDTKYLV